MLRGIFLIWPSFELLHHAFITIGFREYLQGVNEAKIASNWRLQYRDSKHTQNFIHQTRTFTFIKEKRESLQRTNSVFFSQLNIDNLGNELLIPLQLMILLYEAKHSYYGQNRWLQYPSSPVGVAVTLNYSSLPDDPAYEAEHSYYGQN
ncbi:hypothetical protein TNCV_1750891 [Trichonephila clavipes]|nr:hypothetical protein TNCV_1750891 [Trichonephila clavipes]